jgi:hypothetical protein
MCASFLSVPSALTREGVMNFPRLAAIQVPHVHKRPSSTRTDFKRHKHRSAQELQCRPGPLSSLTRTTARTALSMCTRNPPFKYQRDQARIELISLGATGAGLGPSKRRLLPRRPLRWPPLGRWQRQRQRQQRKRWRSCGGRPAGLAGWNWRRGERERGWHRVGGVEWRRAAPAVSQIATVRLFAGYLALCGGHLHDRVPS